MPPTIRFAENLADASGVESDDAWCPPTVSLPLYVATYGRHAAPLADGSAEEPARGGRWQAIRGAATRLGGWATGRTA